MKLREAEYEVEVHYCEPRQGKMIGKEDDEVDIKNVRSLYYSSTPILLLLCPYIRIVILGMSAGVL